MTANLNNKIKNDDFIIVKGAKEHNLKNVSVTLPRDKLIVFTGLSGSGKSSLAFDTIFSEGQRRYVDSLSTYAKQFIEVSNKPDVEVIDGLSPTISIQQKTTTHNPRSTVGTITEIYDFLRILFTRIAKPFCYQCNEPIASQSAQQIVDQILAFPTNTKINILAPIVRGRKGEYQKELNQLRAKGFNRFKIDDETIEIDQEVRLDKNKKHNIDVYVDRLILRVDSSNINQKISLRGRLQDSVENALKLAEGLVKIELPDSKKETLFSEKFACLNCGLSYPTPEPRTFSFNSPMGACSECEGIGIFHEEINTSETDDEAISSAVIYTKICNLCKGSRLKQESLFFKLNEKNIYELSSLSLDKLKTWFDSLTLTKQELQIADRILKEINERLVFLLNVGVGYLSLARSSQTLSGGESQRIRLASQLGSSLVGVIYVLDEPSIGLHQRDNDRLIETLIHLRDLGNTVIVVEHDKDTIEKADYIVDLGPFAGSHGGEVVSQGSYQDILKNKNSLTAQYLNGIKKIALPQNRRQISNANCINITGINHNNLKNISINFPLSTFICVTGVSGSGKSTLVIDSLYALLHNKIYRTKIPEINFNSISGYDQIDKVIDIDQTPIGRTPRSNPATYTGIFSLIRDIFAQTQDAKARGFKPGRFSFNVKGGRCEKCQGDGSVKVEMHFLSDVYVKCDDCNGKRYNLDTLLIKFKGKSIADVLEMTIDDASLFFENIPSLHSKFKTLADVGLGYITLGQSATTLSGGEAQRLKLAKDLSRRATGKTLYILDEPSTGLHFDDINRLNQILHRLVDQGNTVVVIEHNLEIIKTADYIIDMGPEGGESGGEIIASGTPEEIIKEKKSYTAKYLKPYLQ